MLDRYLRAATFKAALTLALLALASPAFADARTEAAAKALDGKAMQEDYLSTDFDKAIEKLNQAAGKCGADKCSSLLRAQIKRDLGVVQMAKSNRDAGLAAFTEALRADPNLQLDPDTRTKEIDAAWAEAKKQAAAAGGGGGGGAAAGGPPPAGDFTMQPAAETLARTPLDLYGEYSGSDTLAKVVLKYKAFGMTEWKTLEMKAMGSGWGAEIPCADIIEGNVAYYVQGFNASNDPVATSGDRNNPFHTAVKHAFNGEVPHFPGKDAPRQCADAGDCPPDFPGCKKAAEPENPESSLKSEGQDCEEDSECKSGTCAKDKTCAAGEGKSSGKRRRFWVGVDLAYDFVNLPSGTDVCALQTTNIAVGQPGAPFNGPNPGTPVPQANNYYCTVSGSDFPGNLNNDKLISPGQSDKVSPGGFAPANFRAMVSFDYSATSNFQIGLRVGYVFNGYDGAFATKFPLHLEARATYVIGKDALDKAGLAPYIMVAGGASQYSAEVGVTAISAASGVNCAQNPQACTVYAKAWQVGGPGFVSAGAGIRWAFTPAVAMLFGPRFTLAFGNYNTLVALSPELAVQYGF